MKNWQGGKYYRFKREESRFAGEMDRRQDNGKANENNINNHLTHVTEDGARTWSFGRGV